MRWLFTAAMLLIFAKAEAGEYLLAETFWAQPRSGRTILAEPGVRAAVQAWLARPEGRLKIHHARDEEGVARAEELAGWLIALGVPGDRIELSPRERLDTAIGIEYLGH